MRKFPHRGEVVKKELKQSKVQELSEGLQKWVKFCFSSQHADPIRSVSLSKCLENTTNVVLLNIFVSALPVALQKLLSELHPGKN